MEVIHPTDLDEALAALAAHPEAVLLAGGTDLMVEVNFDQIRPEKVILLRRLAELQDVSRQRIGAGSPSGGLSREIIRLWPSWPAP